MHKKLKQTVPGFKPNQKSQTRLQAIPNAYPRY